MGSTNPGPSVRVFGGIGVDDGGDGVSVGGPKQRRLLALLALRANSMVTADWLAENLWDDDDRPQKPGTAVRTYLWRLRSALPESARGWVETEPAGYRFVAPADAVQHLRFIMLRAEAARAREREDPLAAHGLLNDALSLWTGEPFPELEDLDWARPEIEQLRLDRLEMLEERWETALALGRHTQIIGELAAFTSEHRLRDRAARQHALALHRSGRTAAGLDALAGHRRTLADQTGLDPSPAVIELEQAMLAGDSSLQVETVGRPLRGYRLVEQAGAGAFAVVWRGLQPSVDREVAIKQIRSELASQPEFIRRFEAEAHLVARIEHPHVVPLIDFWRDPDSAYLVMRWLRGGTLEQLLDNGPLTVAQTMTLARQICGALAAAHAHSVIHRDVKTANILYDEHGNAFLTDFGIALEAVESGGPEASLSPGSPAYASPEQIRQERLGPQADIFSLGVVLFECLAGALPFPAGSAATELVQLQLHRPYPTLSELRSEVPTSLSDAIAKATAKDPRERFDSVEEFLESIEEDATRGLDSRRAVGVMSTDELANPYKGLRAFDSEDVEDFFGRAALVSELVGHLAGVSLRSRGLLLAGPSGSGKSSVVRAGLMPALRDGAIPGSADWFVTTMVPGPDPFGSLEAALRRIAVNPPPSLLDQLRDGRRGFLRSVRRCLGSDDDQVLVVIDQFEEVFTGASPDEANQFLDALSAAAEDPSSPLRLVITLRADYYDRPLEHPAFARFVKRATVQVTPLAGDELEQVIIEPGRRLGLEFEPGLVARVVAETIGLPSPLPLLQYALSELFDSRSGNVLTLDAYDNLGGLSGALSSRAEAIHAESDEPQRAAIRRTFGRMTSSGEASADLRRRVPIADLGADPATAWVLDRFGAARLVTFDRDPTSRDPTVEVAHEALLREWPRLAGWLAEDLEVLRAASSVAVAATAWDDEGRNETDLYRGGRLESAAALLQTAPDRLRPIDAEFVDTSLAAAEADRRSEQHRLTRLRRLVGVVGVALVIALIAGGLALRQQNRAATAAEQAELATLISRSAAQSSDDPELSLLLSLEAHRRMPGSETEQAVLNALGSGGLPNRVASLPPFADESCDHSMIASDGTAEYAVLDGEMVSRDTLTGTELGHGPPPMPCGRWMADQGADRRYAEGEFGESLWFSRFDGSQLVERESNGLTRLVKSSFGPSRNLVFVDQSNDPLDEIVLLDDSSGEPVGPPISGGGDFFGAVDVSPDGLLAAVGFAVPGRPEGEGRTIILDGRTGQAIFDVDTPIPAQALAFDPAGGQVVIGTFDGSIFTVDIDSRQIVSEVTSTSTSGFIDLDVRSDGLLVSVSTGRLELIDRHTGPIGETVELRDVDASRFRPDGRVLTVRADGRLDTFDLEGNALVSQSWPVDSFAQVTLNAGRAATVGFGGNSEVIDLETGDRTTIELITSDAERFSPLVIYPEPDALWALDPHGVLGRWEGAEMTALLELGGQTFRGGFHLDRLAVAVIAPDGTISTHLVRLDRARPAVVFTIQTPEISAAQPSLDGGLHALDADGTLRTFDSSGSLIGEIATGAENSGLLRVDSTSGRIALDAQTDRATNLERRVRIVDPATGEVDVLPDFGEVANLGFARNGELLAIVSSDGTVRLWDLVGGTSAGLAWDGTGANPGDPPWYDESAESIWVNTSAQLLNIPVNPARWVERACELVGRDLTQEEWDRLVPGDEAPQTACT